MVRIRPKMSCSCKTVNAPIVDIEILEGGFVPMYARDGDAGADLHASEGGYVPSGGHVLMKTGIKIAIPYGYVGLVHPRSGLAMKQGVTVLNAPGTIDSGYRGEVGVLLYNTSTVDVYVAPGDRIAQLVVQKVETVEFNKVNALTESDRGEGGFGSTGV
jgi:dUTP pyrophosphatase